MAEPTPGWLDVVSAASAFYLSIILGLVKYTISPSLPPLPSLSFPFLSFPFLSSPLLLTSLSPPFFLFRYACGLGGIADQIPVDIVANSILCCPVAVARQNTFKIYHMGTSHRNPITWIQEETIIPPYLRVFFYFFFLYFCIFFYLKKKKKKRKKKRKRKEEKKGKIVYSP